MQHHQLLRWSFFTRATPRRSWRCCMRWPRRTVNARISTGRTCSKAVDSNRMTAPSGWLNRALAALPASRAREGGVALGANVPLAMRGPVEVASWSPTKIAALDDETLARITDLYARDPLLSRRLAEALESDAIANEAQGAANADRRGPRNGAGERNRGARRQTQTHVEQRATPTPRAPPPDFSSATTGHASPCSTPPAGIRTPTRAERRDNWRCGSGVSTPPWRRSRKPWDRHGGIPWC